MGDENNAQWLTIIGWGERGISGLTPASQQALAQAGVIFGARRHLNLLPQTGADIREWPVPFADGIPRLLAERGRRVVMLVSGDPFWFGAGTRLARQLDASEWVAHPGASTFSLAAARLGWALNATQCLGLHAAPLTRIRPFLQQGQRLLVLLRDGEAVATLAHRLSGWGFGPSTCHILESLDGEQERIRMIHAGDSPPDDIRHPVAVGIEVAGRGPAIPCASGIPDTFFEHDGQITKQSIRALTIAALAPGAGKRLWDIGTGSGSVAIEWLLAHPGNTAIGFEASPERAARATRNAQALGADWLEIVEGRAPGVFSEQPLPDVVFIGGGLSENLLSDLWKRLPTGVRMVANAVTLESEALLVRWHEHQGGELMRMALSTVGAIGTKRGWKASHPIVQWQVTR